MDILGGYWSQSVIFNSHWENEGIVFLPEPKGVGYLVWDGYDYIDIVIFNWSFVDGKISMEGVKELSFFQGLLKEILPTNLKVTNMKLNLTKRSTLEGKQVDAIEFADSIRSGSDSRYGFVSKDIWGIEFFQNLQDILTEHTIEGST